jgi:type IV secretory pathway TrbD component
MEEVMNKCELRSMFGVGTRDMALLTGTLTVQIGLGIEHMGIVAIGFLMMAWGTYRNSMLESLILRLTQLVAWSGVVWSLNLIIPHLWRYFLN